MEAEAATEVAQKMDGWIKLSDTSAIIDLGTLEYTTEL